MSARGTAGGALSTTTIRASAGGLRDALEDPGGVVVVPVVQHVDQQVGVEPAGDPGERVAGRWP